MKILCVGEMLGDILVSPSPSISFDNDTCLVDSITIKPGGDAFNNSMDLAILGNDVTYIGRIGNDMIGSFLLEEGKKAGIDMSYTRPSQNPHAKMTLLINKDGQRRFLYFPGTSAEFSISDIDAKALAGCQIVTVGGTFHLPAFDGAGTKKLFEMAHKQGSITAMDVTKDFSGRWGETISCLYPHLDYFLPSIEQAEKLSSKHSPEEIAGDFLSQGVGHVVIKLGEDGSYYADRKRKFYCAPYRVPLKDTTGAGDAFVAGFLTAIGKNFPPEASVILATACSAFVIQEIGASAGMRPLPEIESFIASRPKPAITYLS